MAAAGSEVISKTTLQSWFNIGNLGQSDAGCDMKQVDLFTDSGCSTAYTGSQVSKSNSPVSMIIDTTNPIGVTPFTIYVQDTTLGNIKACKRFDLEICGNERVTTSGSISKNYVIGSGSQTILESEFKSLFVSDSENCLVTSYSF